MQIKEGLFMHECILDTFAYFLETTSSVSTVRTGRVPCAALALATVAVSFILSLLH